MSEYVTFTAKQIEAAIEEMAGNMHHGGFLTRRALGDPVEHAPISPSIYRERRKVASRGAMPKLGADALRMALHGLGLAGESGEVVDEIKKHLFHGKPLDREHLLIELGDVLWYVDKLLSQLGFTLMDALKANDDKLTERYPNGWAAADKHYDHGEGVS